MKVVGAIIENNKGDFLLQKRDNKAPNYPLHWTLFAGAVEKSETPKNAILRELKEEISLNFSDIESIYQVQKNIQNNGTIQCIFHIKTNAKTEDLVLKEREKMEFVSRKALFKRKFAFNIKEVFEKYFIYLQNSRVITKLSGKYPMPGISDVSIEKLEKVLEEIYD